MKKLLSILLANVILLSCIPLSTLPVSAEETPTFANSVYYTDLFYAYPYYLVEDAFLAQYSATIKNIYDNVYESYANSPLVVGTGIEYALDTITSPTEVAKFFSDVLISTDWSYNAALDAANEEFVKNMLSQSSVFSAGEAFSLGGEVSQVLEDVVSAFNELEIKDKQGQSYSAEMYVQEAFTMLYERGAFHHISANMVNSLWAEINDNAFQLKDCFKLAQEEFQIAEAIVYCIVMEDARLSIVNNILATQTSDTVLKQGMTRLKNQMTTSFAVRFCQQFLQNTVADQLWGMVDSAVETLFSTQKLNAIFELMHAAFNLLVDVPQYADVLKWQVLICYSRDLADGLSVHARKFTNEACTSNDIIDYESLFSAYDAINIAAMDVAKNIMEMGDPFYEAYQVVEEARNRGEDTVLLKSGKDTVKLSSNISVETFDEIMRSGMYETISESNGSLLQYVLLNTISVSNSTTTVTVLRNPCTFAGAIHQCVIENAALIEAFNNTDAYTHHIANVRQTIQNTPLYNRRIITKETYSKWAYVLSDTVQLRHSSDTVEKDSVYTVFGILRGNAYFSGIIDFPASDVIIDGNLYITASKSHEIHSNINVMGELHLTSPGAVSIVGNVTVSSVAELGSMVTVQENASLQIHGYAVLLSPLINKGYVHFCDNLTTYLSSRIENYGEFVIDGILDTCRTFEIYNWATIRAHTLTMPDNSRYYAQSSNATLYVSGDMHGGTGAMLGTVIFNGTSKQTTDVVNYSILILENTSSSGVFFEDTGWTFCVRTLFQHNNNNYVIEDGSGIFPDYDGDGKADNVDPYPTCAVHEYDDPCDNQCNVCGHTDSSRGHTRDNSCDTDCNLCGAALTPVHWYDNLCDTVCNQCGSERIVGEHVYDTVCDAYCNECGYMRQAEPHTYENAYAVACSECGMIQSSLLSVSNFEDAQLHDLTVYQQTAISKHAARTGQYGLRINGEGNQLAASHTVTTIPGQQYTLFFWLKSMSLSIGSFIQIDDTINKDLLLKESIPCHLNWTYVEKTFTATSEQTSISFYTPKASFLGSPDIYLDDICLTKSVVSGGQTSVSEDVNGLAFKFNVAASNAAIVNGTCYVNRSAQIIPQTGGHAYPLVRMGAVVSNTTSTLTREGVNGSSIIDIEAVYLCELDESSLSYAVRIINIPESGLDTTIYARPYYVYEKDGEEIVVYGDVADNSYNAALAE